MQNKSLLKIFRDNREENLEDQACHKYCSSELWQRMYHYDNDNMNSGQKLDTGWK